MFIDILFVNNEGETDDDGGNARSKKSSRREIKRGDDVPMTNVVARTLQRRASSKRDAEWETVRVDDENSEVGEDELDILRASLARSKSLKNLGGMKSASDDPDASLVITPDEHEQQVKRSASSRRATIRVTDDIALDLSVSEDDYGIVIDPNEIEEM